MGQAFTGPMPGPRLQVTDSELQRHPSAGGVYYEPESHAIATYYDDLGQGVPPPGLVLLAELTPSGVDTLAGSGRHIEVTIEPCS